MKIHHVLTLSAIALTLRIGGGAWAETLAGKIISTDNNTLTIQQADGTKQTVQTNDNTTFHKKKLLKRKKMKHDKDGKMKKMNALPWAEEDDWVEITYTPTSENDWVVEDVTIYDD